MNSQLDRKVAHLRGLQREIVTYLGVVAVLSIIIVGALMFKTSRELLQRQASQHGRIVARLAAEIVESTWDSQRPREHVQEHMARLTETTEIAGWTFNARTEGQTSRDREVTEGDEITVYRTIYHADLPVGVLGITLRTDTSFLGLEKVRRAVAFYVIVFSLVLVWFGFRLIRYTVVDPLKRMEKAAQAIADGDMTQQVPIVGSSEVNRLGHALEDMRQRLVADREKLSNYTEDLESLNEELEDAQRALVRGEKLASVGRLAAGVAHEVGNPLGAVIGYLGILRSTSSDLETKDVIDRCENELSRISRIIRQLLDYSRTQPKPEAPCDVNDVVRGTVETVSIQEKPKEFTIQMDLGGNIPLLWINADPLRQVLWNLILNAIDEIQEGGHIAIQTERLSAERFNSEPLGFLFKSRMRKSDSPLPGLLTRRLHRRQTDVKGLSKEHILGHRRKELPDFLFEGERDVVRIMVGNDGSLISPEDIGKIFDPFYTTKSPGKGSGLGLFISLNLVEALGGFLDVRSDPDHGTTFIIVFPVNDEPDEEAMVA